jgi:hypothetical protein
LLSREEIKAFRLTEGLFADEGFLERLEKRKKKKRLEARYKEINLLYSDRCPETQLVSLSSHICDGYM